MLDLRTKFIHFYYNVFQTTDEYKTMIDTVEDSPWHRERNVATHTDMVVAQYVSLAGFNWSKKDVLGALACAFHDVGKPIAEEVCHSEERGTYRRYRGHELASARLWETFAVKHINELSSELSINEDDIYRVGWVIQNHLPYETKKQAKRDALRTTIESTVGLCVFFNCILADTRGRMSDDAETKIRNAKVWCETFETTTKDLTKELDDEAPILYVNIGASGSGKSTFTTKIAKANYTLDVFSLDTLRMSLYCPEGLKDSKEGYENAYLASTEDKEFSKKSTARFNELLDTGNDIVVDNVNASAKSRRQFIDAAKRKGYVIQANLFPNDVQTVIDRQTTRTDKIVPSGVVFNQYMHIQYPSYGEVDLIKVICTF